MDTIGENDFPIVEGLAMKLGGHSPRKFGSTYARRCGGSCDDVDLRG